MNSNIQTFKHTANDNNKLQRVFKHNKLQQIAMQRLYYMTQSVLADIHRIKD